MDSQAEAEQKEQEVLPTNPISLSKYSNRVELKTLVEGSDSRAGLVGKRVVIGGWVKSSKMVKKDSPPPLPDQGPATVDVSCTEIMQSKINIFRKLLGAFSGGGRPHPAFDKPESAAPPPLLTMLYFLINDGSSVSSFQVVVDPALSSVPAAQLLAPGTCIVAEGVLTHPTVASGKHSIELKAEKLLHVGTVDLENYPLSKKRPPLHMLRDYSHFRPRTTAVASMTRIHSALTLAIHTFFELNGFQYVQVPVITTTDAEGLGEMFRVTTLLGNTVDTEEEEHFKERDEIGLDAVKASMKEKSELIEQLKRTESNREAVAAAVLDLKRTSDLASQLEMRQKPQEETLSKHVKFDVAKDFFCRETYLTVSGRSHLESYACALGKVYTFGPRFRADKIDDARHLAEMWNVETEMAFSELDDAMNCADEFFKFLSKSILENRSEDMKFISNQVDKNLVTRLEAVASSPLLRHSYTEVISLLQQASDRKFETKPVWGAALTPEHLSYLADVVYKGPVIIYNYPKAVKPFYVSLNDDKKTVAAFDLIVPKVGVMISGSQNEERFDVLDSRMRELGLPRERYEWYLDLRRHGTAKHSGFNLAMELMLLFATGLSDIRDAVPFPRSCGKANY